MHYFKTYHACGLPDKPLYLIGAYAGIVSGPVGHRNVLDRKAKPHNVARLLYLYFGATGHQLPDQAAEAGLRDHQEFVSRWSVDIASAYKRHNVRVGSLQCIRYLRVRIDVVTGCLSR